MFSLRIFRLLFFLQLLACSTPEPKEESDSKNAASSTVPEYLQNYFKGQKKSVPEERVKERVTRSSLSDYRSRSLTQEELFFDRWRTNGFRKEKSSLSPSEELRFVREKIPQIKQWLRSVDESVKLEVKGHADNDGDDSDYANEVVSKGRSYYIRNLLLREGISKYRIRLAWVADREPLNPQNPAAKANRRVSFRPLGKYDKGAVSGLQQRQGEASSSSVSVSNEPALINKGGITYVTSATGFKLKGADQGSLMKNIEYKINQADFQDYSTPIFFNREGSYRLVYRSVDAVGNIEPNNELGIIVDDTPPSINVRIEGPIQKNPDQTYLSGQSKLILEAEDSSVGLNQIYVSINEQGFKPYTGPIELTNVPPNLKVHYSADDLLDNLVEPKLYNARIDVVGPRLSINPSSPLIPGENDTFFTRGDTRIKVEPSDEESGPAEVYIKIDNARDYSIYYEPIKFYRQGPHQLSILPYDKVGNPGQEIVMNIIIDESPPLGYEQITGPYIEAGAYALLSPQSEISLFGQDEISGVSNIEFTVNDNKLQPYVKPIRIGSEGHVRIKYRVLDNVGISSMERTIRTYVDSTPPQVRIIAEKRVVKIARDFETQFFTNSDNSFRVEAIDTGVGVQQLLIKLSEEEGFRPYSGPLRFPAGGEYTIYAISEDRVGNRSKEIRYRFFVDSAQPVTDFETVGR
jgi:outer membrane protein OmpA-like peptidoglycan-associated protein